VSKKSRNFTRRLLENIIRINQLFMNAILGYVLFIPKGALGYFKILF